MSDWIPVSERLPDYGFHVLACTKSGEVREDCHFGDNEWDSEQDITHWMPLPEPPND